MLTARDVVKIVFGWSPRDDVASRETAWLDGVRGVAAFLVMINHFSMEWVSPYSDAPFGATALKNKNFDSIWYHREGDRLWAPWRLPILRIFMVSGGAQVAVFFVLSGMVLSWSPIGSIQAGNYEKLYQSLGSSTIRRYFRLFLPCVFASIPYLIARIIEECDSVQAGFAMVWDYITFTEQWAKPFNTNHIAQFTTNHPYNFVMWTIPFEFAGSIYVYVCLFGIGRVQNFSRRLTAIALVSMYAFFSLQWSYWLFGTGICISDYVRRSGGFRKLSQRQTTLSCCIWSSALLLGLVLMGYCSPSEWYDRPGYEWTEYMPLPPEWRPQVGQERFWWGCGGTLVVLSSCHLSLARRFFELAFIQHLGKISFMLYIIHFFINTNVSQPIRSALYRAFCVQEYDEAFNTEVYRSTPLICISVHIILWLVSIPIVMIVAHFLETFVDRPCTVFGKWLDEKLLNGIRLREKKAYGEEEEQLLAESSVALELNEVARK